MYSSVVFMTNVVRKMWPWAIKLHIGLGLWDLPKTFELEEGLEVKLSRKRKLGLQTLFVYM